MQELYGRELVSSQRTGLAETGKEANNEVNKYLLGWEAEQG
jgi:hypothetical protein